jgi:hypothetical protein
LCSIRTFAVELQARVQTKQRTRSSTGVIVKQIRIKTRRRAEGGSDKAKSKIEISLTLAVISGNLENKYLPKFLSMNPDWALN